MLEVGRVIVDRIWMDGTMESMEPKLSCFKAYDVRGKVPDELDEDLAYLIGLAYVEEVQPLGPVAAGIDVRRTSRALADALIRGLNEGGVDVHDIGLCGTEMVYFAASRPGMGGGIMITASHNPMEYNGIKFVREEARPISGDSGLDDIEARVRRRDIVTAECRGETVSRDVMEEYVASLLRIVGTSAFGPLKVVVNSGNGCAGPVLDVLAERLPFEFVRLYHEPDGSFPNGIPNPLLPENRPPTVEAVREHGADLGVAWDGDFDRCFLFDEKGGFIEGYYIVGLLAEQMLRTHPGAKVIHDPRLIWNTIEMVRGAGGTPVQNKSGHAFIKERMRAERALYGGEMSAHHYFQEFSYCDSGMIPWLMAAAILCGTGRPLSELLGERMQRYPCSGEINRAVEDPDAVISAVQTEYRKVCTEEDHTDGLSMAFDDRWRFNVRKSNTESLLRLNVEAREDRALMEERTEELLGLIDRA